MIADPARRKFIIVGAIAAVSLIGFGSFIAWQSSHKIETNPKAIPPKRPPIPSVPPSKTGPTPKGMIATYPIVKLAEVSGRISGLGKNDQVVIYIGWSWSSAEGGMAGGASFRHFGSGKYHYTPSFRIEPGEEPENLIITIEPKKVSKGFKPLPERYKLSISKGEKIEDVNFRFVKRENV